MSVALLSPQQAADRLGVSPRTLRRYVKAGRITPVSHTPGGHGRFDPEQVDALKATPATA